jgi:heme o synthase
MSVVTYDTRVATVGDFIALLKPRVMSLVVFTGLAGIVIAPGGVHPLTAIVALLCIAMGAGASGALNMAYDADIDALMSRTAARPIPAGRMGAGDAWGFGGALAILSVTLMALFVNLAAAALLAFTIGFYIFVYTMWLKRRTPQNIVIGGLAGALPPAIGWAAVTGSLAVAPVVLVAIVFLWTPPHFWALALYRNEDYARANVPMLPVVAGKAAARRQIVLYSIVLVLSGLAPAALGFAGPAYLAASASLGLWFVSLAFRVLNERDQANEPAARLLFKVSILYLFALFAALIAETVLDIAPFAAVL